MNIIKEMLERADMNTIQTFLQYGCDCALETTIKTYEERLKNARMIALNFFESRFTDIDELDEVTRDFDIQSEVYKDVYFEIGLLSRKRVIRTRLKRRNFGIFWLIVLERRQPTFVLCTKICSKFHPVKVVEFSDSGFSESARQKRREC